MREMDIDGLLSGSLASI